MATAVAEEKKSKTVVSPFAIEIDTPNNSDVALQAIVGCKLRGAVSVNKPVADAKSGEERIPKDQAIGLGSLPNIPGMQVHVNPAECSYKIIDPLCEDEDLCERIGRYIDEGRAFKTNSKLKGVKEQKGVLDVHRTKNLCREMIWLLEANEAKLVKGIKPKIEDVDGLPGNYMLNPGCRIANLQPNFEKDFDRWVANLARSGG